MKTLPKDPGWMGDPSRGASMGRASHTNPVQAPKLTLQRVRINSQGYDSGGAYWGIGEPLYWCADDDGEIDLFFRADDRDEAKAYIRHTYPGARFHR